MSSFCKAGGAGGFFLGGRDLGCGAGGMCGACWICGDGGRVFWEGALWAVGGRLAGDDLGEAGGGVLTYSSVGSASSVERASLSRGSSAEA